MQVTSTHIELRWSVGHKGEPCKKLNQWRCADNRPQFLNCGSTTERYAAGFSGVHCTYHKFVGSFRQTEINYS